MTPLRTFLILSLVLVLGCAGSGPIPVSGTVTLDGQPLPDGDIVFVDSANKVGPDAGKILNGQFAFKATVGSKKVQINASRLEKLPPGKRGAMGETEVPTDYIPSRYNTQSQLTAEVTRDGPNQYQFELRSK